MNEPIITIYITNKNYGRYLENSIKSALNQNFKYKEVIVIDDGSNDNSKKIIQKYENKKLCRAIYNKKSKGLIKSSNIAIKASRGKFIIRLDADDYLHPNALSIFYDKIKTDSSTALVYSDYYLVDKNKNILSLEKQFNRSGSIDNDKPVLAACCLIRKNAIFSVNLYDERFNRQDGYDLWYKLIKNYKLQHVSLPLFFYRRHDKNLTTNQNKLYKVRTKILRKFSEKKKKIINLDVYCVIPVRGPNIDRLCNSLEILDRKPLIFHTIDEALKVKEFKKIILTTSDDKLIKFVKKKYKNRIFYHKRSKNLSQQNLNFKEAVINSVNKFSNNIIDILVIMTLENPFRKYFYLEQAISNLIIHESDLVVGTLPDIENTYYKSTKNGIKLISNSKNHKLKLEKNIVFKEVGAFNVYNYNSYLKDNIRKITSVVLDEQHSKLINSKSDLRIAKTISTNVKKTF